ncbi:jerky-like protein [Trichonephila clavipes]|nr:jerky-like protein [Trichonephila clavipes]
MARKRAENREGSLGFPGRWLEEKEREANDVVIDLALYLWFSQRRSKSDPLLCEKALELNEKFDGSAYFKASTGWLKNFKPRHGIRELQIEGEILPSIVHRKISDYLPR